MEAQLSTLCYLEQDGKYLMLHRVVKKNDINKDKWIGVGGHFERDESPDECLLREVREETGYTLTSYRFRGIVTFVSGGGETEYMHLYTADGFTGEPIECDEGVLEWVPKDRIEDLNIWEGDKIFFRLLNKDEPFFSLKLVYDGAGTLVRAALNGREMPPENRGGIEPAAAAAGAAAGAPAETAGKIPKAAILLGIIALLAAAVFWSRPRQGGSADGAPPAGQAAGTAAENGAGTAAENGAGTAAENGAGAAAGTAAESVMLAKVNLDARTVSEIIRAADMKKFTTRELILINPWHILPENYESYLENVEYGHRMDECAAEHLRDMMADCRSAGHSPLICSSFRERSKQETLFENDVRRFMYRGYTEDEAVEETARNVALPGSSEHEAGLAADIVYLYHQSLDESQENNETQQWLMEHCWEYGFILRYPRDKQDITGITYEPWHYRYVGCDAAEEIMTRGICLEEYLGVIDGE